MSFIPGLGLPAPTAQQPPQVAEARTVTLLPGSEWRFEVSSDTVVSVKLLPTFSSGQDGSNDASDASQSNITGTAEVFGTELAPNHVYEFSGLTKAAVYTHHGCSLSITGSCESEYTAEETPMTQYSNLHFALENMRTEASTSTSSSGGPRVLVIGPKDSGKTSLVKLLTAYATRMGHTPLVVNLDPSEGMLCLPGSISAAVMGPGTVLDIEDSTSNGWGSSPIGGPSLVPVKTPLVYHYGYAAPEERLDVFKPVTTRLALPVTSRFAEDKGVREAGMLIDIAGSVANGKAGYDIISHVVNEFSINVLLILGSERLYSDMSKRFATPASASNDERIYVLRLPKSGGCVDRDEAYMRQLRQAQIRAYFFGASPKNALNPHTLNVEFDTVPVLKMSDPNASDSIDQFLPGSDDAAYATQSPTLYSLAPASLALQSALLVLKQGDVRSKASGGSYDTIRDTPVNGYVYVADIDETRKRLKLLSPVGGRLPPRSVAVWGPWDGELAVGVGGLLGS